MFLYRKILSPGLWLQHFQPMSQLYIILYMVGCVNHFSSKFRLNFARKTYILSWFWHGPLNRSPIHDLSHNCCRKLRDPERVPDRAAAEQMAENKGGRKDDYDIAEQGDHKGLDTHADSLEGTRRCYGDR